MAIQVAAAKLLAPIKNVARGTQRVRTAGEEILIVNEIVVGIRRSQIQHMQILRFGDQPNILSRDVLMAAGSVVGVNVRIAAVPSAFPEIGPWRQSQDNLGIR